jgi:hypothetical protein
VDVVEVVPHYSAVPALAVPLKPIHRTVGALGYDQRVKSQTTVRLVAALLWHVFCHTDLTLVIHNVPFGPIS